MSFLEQIWDHIRTGKIQNHPYPVALNINLAYTVMLPDKVTHLFWLPFEYTGLCYRDQGTYVNIHPYYKGMILEDVELSHGTDLYKPKSEKDFMKKLYQLSWDIEQSILHQADQLPEPGCAADYILKMYHFAEWLRYYNSAAQLGRVHS
jgi:hypothetical protein